MIIRILLVAVCCGWVAWLTYTVTAALVTGVPHLPEAARAAVLALLVAGLVVTACAELLRADLRRLVAELRRPAAPPNGEATSVAYLSDAAELYELGKQAGRLGGDGRPAG
jgi:hypothetical protein